MFATCLLPYNETETRLSNMQVTVNGETHRVTSGETISGLLRTLEIKPDRVAVELDRAIVKKALWDSTLLHDGAEMEIVHFVGGG